MAAIMNPGVAVSKADNVRERELYRYFQPSEDTCSNLSAHEASSPDTTLTALAQLCALRLNAKRAIISVIDRTKQYLIAEATRTLNLANTNNSKFEDDGLWFGCGTLDKAGGLCENTIKLPPSLERQSCFIIKDLSKDERFRHLPIVTGPPYFKFYAGTPLTTRKGVNIGSLCIIDDIAREPLAEDQERFLGTIAQTVMNHMETASEAQERKKVMRLSMGMNAFVEGRSRLSHRGRDLDTANVLQPKTDGERQSSPTKRSKSRSKSRRISPTRESVSLTKQSSAGKFAPTDAPVGEMYLLTAIDDTRSPIEPETFHNDSDSRQAPKSIDTDHRMTFTRAANILCETLGVRDQGGVVFFDTTSRLRTKSDSNNGGPHQPAEILSYSTSEAEMSLGDKSKAPAIKSFSPVDGNLLSSLLSRYRRGHMWSFDEDGNLWSSEEDSFSPSLPPRDSENIKQNRIDRKQCEVSLLQKHFPGARQILFSGLWDAGSSRWFTAGFAWTTSNRQILTKETELSYFLAFGKSVMAEVSRLASIRADHQKADFIGSISHEFRSPLHGILASAEFLAETEVDAFQSSLVETMSSCGRTLLDTINHILDYSKINSFERNCRNVRKPGWRSKARTNRRSPDKEAPPMMNIYATIDVAAVTEEVIEGVYAGQIYQDISSIDATDFSAVATADAVDRGIVRKQAGKAKDIEVLIDISRDNYVFTTQPGALKRVIMNVFGNALKYSTKGYILVKLSLDAVDDANNEMVDERMLEFKVIDTGKGISSEYLRTSLFNPFCQEDPLASGTGLGLSIVKSIVTMLKGTIDIQSEVGKGTEVTLRLPLSRLPGTATPVSTPSSNSTEQSTDMSINALESEHGDISVGLLGFSEHGQGTVLTNCIEDWLGLKVISFISPEHEADVCIVDEKELENLSYLGHSTLPIVVLCMNATRAQTASRHYIRSVAEYISKPVGPRKLAKALRSCLDRARSSRSCLNPIVTFSDEASPLESVAGTEVPDLEINHLTLENEVGTEPFQVQTNEVITASESDNAQMAIDHSSTSSNSATVSAKANPFFLMQEPLNQQTEIADAQPPSDLNEKKNSPYEDALTRRDSRRLPLISRTTDPVAKTPFPPGPTAHDGYEVGITFPLKPADQPQNSSRKGLQDPKDTSRCVVSDNAAHAEKVPAERVISQPAKAVKRTPRLLLVDDNKINLRLLETYMRKRKYQSIDSAENGKFAVQAAEALKFGYDIIFMDISMPVMNGFEATRAIRDIEDARSQNSGEGNPSSSAFIIALTGLASSRDQAEAFTSGVDLFMTKPVSFKEVGKLLDNWEAHGGMKPQEGNTGPNP